MSLLGLHIDDIFETVDREVRAGKRPEDIRERFLVVARKNAPGTENRTVAMAAVSRATDHAGGTMARRAARPAASGARQEPGGLHGPEECQRCDGTGDRLGRRGSYPPSQRCPRCDGRGVLTSGAENEPTHGQDQEPTDA
jgi:DnaJ-class molecular chaperone